MEIYTLKISFAYSDKEYPWSRTIEVGENFTLQNLHNYIQEIVEFDNDHLFEFYAGKNHRNRSYKISQKTKLNEIYPMVELKLFYLFDFGDNWLFKIMKLKKKKTSTNNTVLPTTIKSVGENPQQYGEYDEWEE